jgi:hypothetical protein
VLRSKKLAGSGAGTGAGARTPSSGKEAEPVKVPWADILSTLTSVAVMKALTVPLVTGRGELL